MLKQIGKYTISERIGRGTYSRVYRAVDSQGRPVAIKVSTTQTEPEHLDEFQKDLGCGRQCSYTRIWLPSMTLASKTIFLTSSWSWSKAKI